MAELKAGIPRHMQHKSGTGVEVKLKRKESLMGNITKLENDEN